MTNETLLVTGASGRLGKLVVEALIAAGASRIVAATRAPDQLDDFAQRGVDVRAADFTDPTRLPAAFAGVDRMLIISTADVGARVAHQKAAVDAAAASGVRHIVYTSWPDPEQSLALVGADHAATERDIFASGLSYTMLRNYTYAENLFYSLPTALATGTLYGCAGAGRVAYVSRQDCANAAAAVLLAGDKYADAVLDVTGPRAYSHDDVVQLTGKILGREIDYQDLVPEAFHEALVQRGMPEAYAGMFVSFDKAVRNGELENVSPAVEALTGTPAQDLGDFLRSNLTQFAAYSL